jgi:hypothetical protein
VKPMLHKRSTTRDTTPTPRTVRTALTVAGLVSAALLGFAPGAGAAQVAPNITPPPTPVTVSGPPSIQLFDCSGTTGVRGCGGGWHWRDGWYGFGCYPC